MSEHSMSHEKFFKSFVPKHIQVLKVTKNSVYYRNTADLGSKLNPEPVRSRRKKDKAPGRSCQTIGERISATLPRTLAGKEFYVRATLNACTRATGKFEAIRMLRESTQLGLRDAKNAVEASGRNW